MTIKMSVRQIYVGSGLGYMFVQSSSGGCGFRGNGVPQKKNNVTKEFCMYVMYVCYVCMLCMYVMYVCIPCVVYVYM